LSLLGLNIRRVRSQGFGPTEFELWEEGGDVSVEQFDEDRVKVIGRLEENSPYGFEALVFVGSHGPQLVGLRFSPWSNQKWPPETLTTAMIRSIRLDRLYEMVRHAVSNSRPHGIDLDVDLTEFARNRRPGRRGRPDVFYARLAAEYVDLLSASSTPTKDLAERHNYSATSVRDFLNQARTRGLLTRSQQGRAGGELTEAALKLLSKHGKGT
jgi:hypothetical protein